MNPRDRALLFCDQFGLRVPVLMVPMAGSSPVALALAVAEAGGVGACGAMLMSPKQISAWASAFRACSNGTFQVNIWIPDEFVPFDVAAVEAMTLLLNKHDAILGPITTSGLPEFSEQCAAIVEVAPPIVSSIMGLYPPNVVEALHARGSRWFANVTSVHEACAAQEAGADAIVVSGIEAGGHRGAFDPADAERHGGTLFALLPIVCDAVSIPVIAAGGIADGRALAAALTLGASAVQVGTALLRSPEAGIAAVWSDAIAQALPEDTVLTRAFSGRLARAVRNGWIDEVGGKALPYPAQRQATLHLRTAAIEREDPVIMQMWAGQAASKSRAVPAGMIVSDLWEEANVLLA